MVENNKNKYKRPSWDEYFINLTEIVGSRGTCDRGMAGAILVKDNRILSTGYVGAPSGLPSCDEIGHEMNISIDGDDIKSNHCIRTAHAEQNAINNAARVGVAVKGAILYCKMTPCYKCAQSIINTGIVKVIALKDYHKSKRTKEIFKQANIKLEIQGGVEVYKNI